jgi:hypothetical protein
MRIHNGPSKPLAAAFAVCVKCAAPLRVVCIMPREGCGSITLSFVANRDFLANISSGWTRIHAARELV